MEFTNQKDCLQSNKELIAKLKSSTMLSYFLIDIDNFSNINNTYGYDRGDKVIQEVGRLLTMIKPASSEIYRFDSDKFVMLDDRELDPKEIQKASEFILSFFSQTEIDLDNNLFVKVSLSIGVSVDNGLVNISNAEMAIKELRKNKRNHFNIYNESSRFIEHEKNNIYWIHKIKEAVEDENIVAYFQPIINNKTGKIEKYECLARLNDDDEIISPYMFLGAAKATNNLSYVTKSLIAQSCAKFSGTEYQFSINITGEDLSLCYLEDVLLKNFKKFKIKPSQVVLEILEDITTLEDPSVSAQISSLRDIGLQIAIDDFGAENSNLSRLLEIEPDYLKIDGAFIKNILTDTKSQIIVEAIILICKKSNIKMIAEYVHSKAVYEKIKELGIDYSQGYYLGQPSADLQ